MRKRISIFSILFLPVLLNCMAFGMAVKNIGESVILDDGDSFVPDAPANIHAGEPAYRSLPWVTTGGPVGGLGYDIRMDPRNPDVMYVTDAWAGAFKSVDGGRSWFSINEGITSRVGPSLNGIPVFSLTIDPNNPDTLWLGTQSAGSVFRSDDGGAHWVSKSNGIQEQALTIRGFTVAPGNSDVVYLAGEISSWEWNGSPLPGLGFDLTKGTVYKTVDGGESWQRIWLGDNLARYVLIHPAIPNRLFVSTGIFDREAANSNYETKNPGGVGIVRSIDGGQTWETLGVENGIHPDELYFGSLALHPQNPDILLGAAGNDPYMWYLGREIGAIYRTVDGGDTWQRVLHLPNASAVEICTGDPRIMYAASVSQFYRSEDSGLTWQKYGGAGPLDQGGDSLWGTPGIVAGFPIDLQCDPRNPMRIFVNNYGGGNFLSDDGGQTWMDASKGYTGAHMKQIDVAVQNPALVYAAARSGVFVSDDGGENWEGISRGVARAMEAWVVAVDPGDEDHIIAIIADAGPIPKISLDGGRTWHESDPGLWNEEFVGQGDLLRKIEFSPSDPDIVLAAQAHDSCLMDGECEEGRGVFLSQDGGHSWQRTSLQEGMATALAFAPDGRAYVAVFPDDLYRSSDDGQQWELVGRGFLNEIAAGDPDMPGPALAALSIDPFDADRLYAGFLRGGVMVSEDGGRSWRQSSAGMPPETSVRDIVSDAAHPGVIYAATRDSGVFVSLDGGASWQAINAGLQTRAGVDLALSADGRVLYLATEGGGVFRLGTP